MSGGISTRSWISRQQSCNSWTFFWVTVEAMPKPLDTYYQIGGGGSIRWTLLIAAAHWQLPSISFLPSPFISAFSFALRFSSCFFSFWIFFFLWVLIRSAACFSSRRPFSSTQNTHSLCNMTVKLLQKGPSTKDTLHMNNDEGWICTHNEAVQFHVPLPSSSSNPGDRLWTMHIKLSRNKPLSRFFSCKSTPKCRTNPHCYNKSVFWSSR